MSSYPPPGQYPPLQGQYPPPGQQPYGYPPPGGAYQPPPNFPPRKPGVWTGYVIYCILMGLMYLGLAVFGAWIHYGGGLTMMEDELDSGYDAPYSGYSDWDPDPYGSRRRHREDLEQVEIMGWIFLAMGVPLTVLFLGAPLLPKQPWAWVYHMVLICLGLTSVCTLPFCIAMLIFWLKDNTKAFFGKTPKPAWAPYPQQQPPYPPQY